ncbi:MAG TPA: MBL fold metallo-hydrolase [Steroidobacteraceae bacterium]|nr:MBL fold metallo-hydrolase [Steroidobacteraceae bacterium]
MKVQKLGAFEIHKVLEMEQAAPMTMAFPDITAADLARLRSWYSDAHLSPEPHTAQMNLSVHSFVLRCRGRNILIDACNGNHKQRTIPFAHMLETPYLQRLAEAGFAPEDIHLVLCTHLHGDHVGWNTQLRDGRWVPTFPNARYVFTRPDVEYFSSHGEEPFHGEAYLDSVLPIIEAGQAHLVETAHSVYAELDEGVWLSPAPGHSPGSCLIHARSAGSQAIFSGDLFHHPVELVRPTMPFFADFDPVMTGQTRKRVFEEYADRDVRFFPAHFADPTAGWIRGHGDVFRFQFA